METLRDEMLRAACHGATREELHSVATRVIQATPKAERKGMAQFVMGFTALH